MLLLNTTQAQILEFPQLYYGCIMKAWDILSINDLMIGH